MLQIEYDRIKGALEYAEESQEITLKPKNYNPKFLLTLGTVKNIKELFENNEQLEKEIAELKQQLQGLTPEMIQGFKDLIETKILCSVCAHKNNEDCHGDWCVNADDECINMRYFDFFNDSEGENE